MPQKHVISAEVNAPLDEDKLVRLYAAQVPPLVGGVEFHAERLTIAIRVLERGGYEVVLAVDAAIVAQRQRPVLSGMGDWPPEVNDLESSGEKLGDVRLRKMAVDTSPRGFGGLINVDLGHWLSFLWGIIDLAGSTATDS